MSYQGYPYIRPPVIDVPTLSTVQEHELARWRKFPVRKVTNKDWNNAGASSSSSSAPTNDKSDSKQKDAVDTPVLYIDIPESGAIVERRVSEEPDFIQDTIYYNPFEDDSNERNEPLTSNTHQHASSNDQTQDYIPPISKEASIYRPQPQSPDGFTLTPLPVNDRPHPPSYDEVERMDSDRTRDPPRTQVITIDSTPIPGQFDRKYVNCQFCRNNVRTKVVREDGLFTYVAILVFAIVFLPLVALVFCTETYKYKNHYCPTCNMKIGYEIPFLCVEMTFTQGPTI